MITPGGYSGRKRKEVKGGERNRRCRKHLQHDEKLKL